MKFLYRGNRKKVGFEIEDLAILINWLNLDPSKTPYRRGFWLAKKIKKSVKKPKKKVVFDLFLKRFRSIKAKFQKRQSKTCRFHVFLRFFAFFESKIKAFFQKGSLLPLYSEIFRFQNQAENVKKWPEIWAGPQKNDPKMINFVSKTC